MTPDAELQIFAIKRGMIEKRMDVSFFQLMQKDISIFNMVTLGELCCEEPNYGSSQSAVKKEHYQQPNYIRITDFSDVGIEKNHEFVSVEKYSSKDVLKDKDLLFARTGASVGKTYIHNEKIGFSVFAGYCIRFRLNQEKVLPEYVWAYTKTKRFSSWVQQTQRKSGQPNINKEEYKSILIPLPSIRVQQEMVTKFIIALENRSKKLQQADELLAGMDEFVLETLGIKKQDISSKIIFGVKYADVYKSRIDAIFNNPHFVTRIAALKELPHDNLENIIEFSDEVWNGKDFFEDVFPYIEISNIGLKNNIWHSNATSMDKIPSRAKMVVRNGDIIVSTTRPHRGAIAMLTFEKEQVKIASTGFSVLRNLKRSDILKEYLYWVLLNDYVLQQMLQRSSGGNYPAINQDELKKIIIPIPSIDKQKKIIAEAERRKKLSAHLKNEAEKEWQDAREQFEKELLGE